jgi:predicted TIM-barrel fold metal-dependent hydrolase
MIAVPLPTEQQLHEKLAEAGFSKTLYGTDTASIWVHVDKKRHLTVPHSKDGFYPSWMLDQLKVQARILGDDALVNTIAEVNGWERLVAKPKRRKPPTKRV